MDNSSDFKEENKHSFDWIHSCMPFWGLESIMAKINTILAHFVQWEDRQSIISSAYADVQERLLLKVYVALRKLLSHRWPF